MLSQIGSLKGEYTEWVNKPVDRPLRLFGPDWLEMLTKTPWWAVPLFWIPSITYITKIGLNEARSEGLSSVRKTFKMQLQFTYLHYKISELFISKFYRWHSGMDHFGILFA